MTTKTSKATSTTKVRARYTLAFKQEAVRLVESGQSIAAAARTLGVADAVQLGQGIPGGEALGR